MSEMPLWALGTMLLVCGLTNRFLVRLVRRPNTRDIWQSMVKLIGIAGIVSGALVLICHWIWIS